MSKRLSRIDTLKIDKDCLVSRSLLDDWIRLKGQFFNSLFS